MSALPTRMDAIVLDRLGPDAPMRTAEVAVPEMGDGEVLVRVAGAGIGSWDPFERAGGYAELTGMQPSFPYVLGSDGAGEVVATGPRVERFAPGDQVYGSAFLNPSGGFYAAAVSVEASMLAPVPPHLDLATAGGLPGAVLTALRGLEDVLAVGAGETVAVVGASGALGHVAVQLAAGLGARVVAIASGPDGVALCQRLGAAAAVDGRADDLAPALEQPAPEGFDAVLSLAGGGAAKTAIDRLRSDGRAAHPTGTALEDGRSTLYNAEPDAELTRRLERVVRALRVELHVSDRFGPSAIEEAHAALERHHLGKLLLDTADLRLLP